MCDLILHSKMTGESPRRLSRQRTFGTILASTVARFRCYLVMWRQNLRQAPPLCAAPQCGSSPDSSSCIPFLEEDDWDRILHVQETGESRCLQVPDAR